MSAETETALLDHGRYPTRHALRTVRTWTGPMKTLVDDVLVPTIQETYGIVDFCTDVSFGSEVVRLSLSTGGWSGCEMVIDALQKTAYWHISWHLSQRGGRHVLEVPIWMWEHGLDAEEAR